MSDILDTLEQDSIAVLRDARALVPKIGLLWSVGKDSTTLLWLARKAFLGAPPFPIVHLDTSYKFAEMLTFRDHWAREWGLDLRVIRNEVALEKGMNHTVGRMECCNNLKTQALSLCLQTLGLRALIVGIRRDEHAIRGKERYCSYRDESGAWNSAAQAPELRSNLSADLSRPGHFRVHPLLAWTELDIWRYVRREGIPVPRLYFAREGRRYRSIGCEPCSQGIESSAADIEAIVAELAVSEESERAGRSLDKEQLMEKLRALGYL